MGRVLVVDWYQPRHNVITKHKDKFDRHLVSIAQKSMAQDQRFEELKVLIEEANVQFRARTEVLKVPLLVPSCSERSGSGTGHVIVFREI